MHFLCLLSIVSLSLLVLAAAGPAHAQILLAEDDSFYVPLGEPLVIEASGILDNDTLDDESAGESGATAELVTDASHGTLALSSDGSFTYLPAASFDGTDSFAYRAVFGAASDEATVTLTACGGGPQIFTCWKKAAFLAKAAALGLPLFTEGFEDDAVWGQARSPNNLPSVNSRGLVWRANDFDPTHYEPPLPPPPPPNEITTGSGPARTGQWGIYDVEHGYATGTSVQCDIDNPPEHCLFHDGYTISRGAGSGPFYGAGGYFTGTYGANVAIVLDGDWQNPIGGGTVFGGGHAFFGVIDAGRAGFAEVQFRETGGKIGQLLLIFADDFTLLAQPTIAIPTLDIPGMIGLGVLLACVGGVLVQRSYASR
jgi:VCBS repeat-containing protein